MQILRLQVTVLMVPWNALELWDPRTLLLFIIFFENFRSLALFYLFIFIQNSSLIVLKPRLFLLQLYHDVIVYHFHINLFIFSTTHITVYYIITMKKLWQKDFHSSSAAGCTLFITVMLIITIYRLTLAIYDKYSVNTQHIFIYVCVNIYIYIYICIEVCIKKRKKAYVEK